MNYIDRRNLLKEFYQSKAWKSVREIALKRDNYICQKCKIRPAELVHHKIHLNPQNVYDNSIALDLNNLISVCASCHAELHKGEHGMGRINEEDYPYTFDDKGMLISKGNIKG